MAKLDKEFETMFGKYIGRHEGVTDKTEDWIQKTEKEMKKLDLNGGGFEKEMDRLASSIEGWILKNHPEGKGY